VRPAPSRGAATRVPQSPCGAGRSGEGDGRPRKRTGRSRGSRELVRRLGTYRPQRADSPLLGHAMVAVAVLLQLLVVAGALYDTARLLTPAEGRHPPKVRRRQRRAALETAERRLGAQRLYGRIDAATYQARCTLSPTGGAHRDRDAAPDCGRRRPVVGPGQQGARVEAVRRTAHCGPSGRRGGTSGRHGGCITHSPRVRWARRRGCRLGLPSPGRGCRPIDECLRARRFLSVAKTGRRGAEWSDDLRGQGVESPLPGPFGPCSWSGILISLIPRSRPRSWEPAHGPGSAVPSMGAGAGPTIAWTVVRREASGR
jgi:hypothetical protein